MMVEGLVLRCYGPSFAVLVGDETLECRVRGRFRKDKLGVITGDRVKVTPTAEGAGVIEEVMPRRSELLRPRVANVEQVVIIFTLREPQVSIRIVDKMGVLAESRGLDVILCLNKVDLYAPVEMTALAEYYSRTGYDLLYTSSRDGRGVADLAGRLVGKISVLAGPSGVGKSSLLNAVRPGSRLKTGALTCRLKRGKHTTRGVELLALEGGGYVADTPGFVALELDGVETHELAGLLPEMRALAGRCRFGNCLHRHEPGCYVKEAVANSQINPARYQNYLDFLEEIESQRRYY